MNKRPGSDDITPQLQRALEVVTLQWRIFVPCVFLLLAALEMECVCDK